jgi:hypothetical protein
VAFSPEECKQFILKDKYVPTISATEQLTKQNAEGYSVTLGSFNGQTVPVIFYSPTGNFSDFKLRNYILLRGDWRDEIISTVNDSATGIQVGEIYYMNPRDAFNYRQGEYKLKICLIDNETGSDAVCGESAYFKVDS